jgi:hypothetical protein
MLTIGAMPAWSRVQVQTRESEEVKQDQAPVVAEVRYFLNQVEETKAGQKPGGVTEQDRRLQAIEQQIQALLKEIHALRNDGKSEARVRTTLVAPTQQKRFEVIRKAEAGKPVELTPGEQRHVQVIVKDAGQDEQKGHSLGLVPGGKGKQVIRVIETRTGDEKHVALNRASYRLPRASAEVVAAFLREHSKAPVMEVKVDGDQLIVTTTPETQKAIGQLIALIQGKRGVPTQVKPSPRGEAGLNVQPIHLDNTQPLHIQLRTTEEGKSGIHMVPLRLHLEPGHPEKNLRLELHAEPGEQEPIRVIKPIR